MGNTGSCVGRSASSPKKGESPTRHGIPLPPGKPRLKEATQTTLHLEWDKPASDGGSTIFAYIVKMSRSGGSAWRKLDQDVAGLDFVAKDLEPGSGYRFFVQCENDNGVSKGSDVSEFFTEKCEAPNDLNENVSETFGSAAEKYLTEDVKEAKKEEEDTQSHKSDASEKSVESNHSEKSGKSSSDSHDSDDEKDVNDAVDGLPTTVHEYYESKTVVTTMASSNDCDVELDDDVGNGKPLGETIGAYTYSNDSLLDDDDDMETGQRFNDQHFEDIQIHSSYNSSMEEYHTIDNEIPDEHRDVLMSLGYDMDPMEYNRLSIISERSMEDSVGTPDPNMSPTKDGSHFTFVKKFNESATNAEVTNGVKTEVEESKTQVSGTETSSVIVQPLPVEFKAETRIPMMSGKSYSTSSSSVSKEVTTSVKEIKLQSKLPKRDKDAKKNTSNEDLNKKEPERKSSIPKVSMKKVETIETKTEKTTTRRGSGDKGESGIPKAKGSSSPTTSNNNSPSTKPASMIPSGIAVRRGSKESNKSDGQEQPKSRIAAPAKSGLRAPRVNVSAKS